MTEEDEFLRGLCAGSALEPALALRAYADWLKGEKYADVHRIELESGGYASGLEVGKKLLLRENSNK